jgi:hypothetical protein
MATASGRERPWRTLANLTSMGRLIPRACPPSDVSCRKSRGCKACRRICRSHFWPTDLAGRANKPLMIVAIARRCFGPMLSLVSLVSCAPGRARNQTVQPLHPFRPDVHGEVAFAGGLQPDLLAAGMGVSPKVHKMGAVLSRELHCHRHRHRSRPARSPWERRLSSYVQCRFNVLLQLILVCLRGSIFVCLHRSIVVHLHAGSFVSQRLHDPV